jgi:hypothetical protein
MEELQHLAVAARAHLIDVQQGDLGDLDIPCFSSNSSWPHTVADAWQKSMPEGATPTGKCGLPVAMCGVSVLVCARM